MERNLEKLFVNGDFYNKDNQNIEYIRISNKKIIASGVMQDLEEDDQSEIEVIDLEGKPVYPGFVDAHLHLIAYAQKKFYEVSLNDCSSIKQVVSKVKCFIDENNIKSGEWVVGSGWNQECFEEKSYLNKQMLDNISNAHPIFLMRACYHICAVNSKALQVCKIDEKTTSPKGGKIDKDIKGVPTGILREAAMELVISYMPSLTKEKLQELIIQGCKDLAKVGVTTVHTDDFELVKDKKILWEAYKELAQKGLLPIHVVLQLRVSSEKDIMAYKDLGINSWQNIKNLRVGPVKIIADGSLGSRTAALCKPYADDQQNTGILLYAAQKLEQLMKMSLQEEFDLTVHAIGDRTINLVLDIYEKYYDLYKNRYFRPSIIHCQIVSEEILKKFSTLDIIANIQPIFLFSDWDVAEARVGKKRLEYSYCWRKFLDAGVNCVVSSDAPIESFNPMYNIHAAINQTDLSAMPKGGWMPAEKLDIKEMIQLYTTQSAFLSHEEHEKGSFEAGKYFDCVVLSEDLLAADTEKIKEIKVEKTIVGGDLIYSTQIIHGNC